MNPLERELEYPFGEALPGPAARIEAAPGVYWIRMPLPFALDHINLWLLRDDFGGAGWTLVDCGIHSEEVRALWARLLESGLDGLPIRRILCTHNHPDHIGMAHTLQRRSGAPLWMTLGEYAMGRVLSAGLPGADGDADAEHFRRNGVPRGPALEAIRSRGTRYYGSLVPSMPESFRRIREHETIRIGGRDWRVIIGIGHSPEHAALYCDADGLLLSGDMVLPRISTNVSVFEMEPEANPVDWYLESLRRFEACREDCLVLPAHGRPFRRLHARLRQLADHHADRLSVVLQACRKAPHSAAEIVPVMFEREFDTHQSTFAIGEALAHLHSLWYAGRLSRRIDDDGVVRFVAAQGEQGLE